MGQNPESAKVSGITGFFDAAFSELGTFFIPVCVRFFFLTHTFHNM